MKLKKRIAVSVLLMSILFCLCGCAKTCEKCGSEIEKGAEIQVGDSYCCEKCVAYCDECKTPSVKDDGSLLAYKDGNYCRECFDKIAYPISLEDNDKVSISITGYDDKEGMFAVEVKNKTAYTISVYQDGDSALMDSKKKCMAETSGTSSFAYVDVPANETATVFSSFRENFEDGFENVLKPSDGHTFEFIMTAWIDDENYEGFWDKKFKVTLTPEMFGYSK